MLALERWLEHLVASLERMCDILDRVGPKLYAVLFRLLLWLAGGIAALEFLFR